VSVNGKENETDLTEETTKIDETEKEKVDETEKEKEDEIQVLKRN